MLDPEETKTTTETTTETVTDDTVKSGDAAETGDTAAPTGDEHVDELTADTPEKKGGIQKKFDRLTKAKADAEREASYWRGVAESKKARDMESTPIPPVKDSKLKPEDFHTYEDYIDAVAEQKAEAKFQASETKRRATEANERLLIINRQYEEARKTHEDFDEVALNPTLPINQTIMDASSGENFAEILYELGKNPGKTAQIARMSPLQAAREIGKIEAKITSPKKTPTTITTKAPGPVPKVSTIITTEVVPDDKKSRKELYAKWDRERRERLGVK